MSGIGRKIARMLCAGPMIGGLALSVFTTWNVRAQAQQSTTPTLKAGITYEDQSSQTCEEQNQNNPYTGMDPLTCYGVMAPQDSRGECSLSGMQVWKHTGETCYYCSPITSPPNTIIVPMDQVGTADNQGFRCGMDQADACMAICSGGDTYTPPQGTIVKGGGPGLPPTPPPPQGGPPPNYAPHPGPPEPSQLPPGGTPCEPFGPGGYNYCANPAGTQPAGCVCSQKPQPAVKPTTPGAANPTLQAVSDFSDKLRADAETILQGAGRISKAMTDAMDATKHNNVGISVAGGAYFGAAGKLMGAVAQEYNTLAAAKAIAAAQQTPILQIADEAAAESGSLAGQAEQSVAQAGKTPPVSTPTGTPPAGGPVGTPGGSPTGGLPMGSGTPAPNTGGTNYQTGMVLKGVAGAPGQGELPICGVLTCARVAEILGKNVPTLRMLSTGVGEKGLNVPQMVAALKRIGIAAQGGTGATKQAVFTNMMNAVRAGKPVIAGINMTGENNGPLHAVVVEGLETVNDVPGVNIYDPAGWYYWQPIKALQTYFTGDFVVAL